MKKSLIALAVAAAVIAPSANAATTLYGKVRQHISKYDGHAFGQGNADATTGLYSGAEATHIHDYTSRIGVKGSEGLGNGLSAIYQFEFGVQLNGGLTKDSHYKSGVDWAGGALLNRNQFVGLKGGFGTVLVGRHDTPAKMVLGKTAYFFTGTHDADDNIGTGFNSSIRANNTILYISPNMSGFTFLAGTIAGENDKSTNGSDGLADGVSVGLRYSNGPFYAGIGYTKLSQEMLGLTAATSSDRKILGLSLAYTPGPWGVGYLYEKTEAGIGELPTKGGFTSNGDEYESHLLVGSYKFGNNVVKAKYGMGEFNGTSGATDLTAWGLMFEHILSKRTKVFMDYSELDVDISDADLATLSYSGDGKSNIVTVGIEHNF